MTHGDLFAGIGGFALAARWCGLKTIWAVEIDGYCQQVYAKHFPDVEMHSDVKAVRELPYVDILTGGFPCQPFSVAGKRKGKGDDRYLWPEMLRIIRAVHPRWVIAENVPGIDDNTNMVLDTVTSNLEGIGYEAIPIEIPACAVGAPHIRQRVWIVAYPNGERFNASAHGQIQTGRHAVIGSGEDVADAEGEQTGGIFQGGFSSDFGSSSNRAEQASSWTVEPNVGRVAHGIPKRVDRLRALGNAIVPQVAAWIIGQIAVADRS